MIEIGEKDHGQDKNPLLHSHDQGLRRTTPIRHLTGPWPSWTTEASLPVGAAGFAVIRSRLRWRETALTQQLWPSDDRGWQASDVDSSSHRASWGASLRYRRLPNDPYREFSVLFMKIVVSTSIYAMFRAAFRTGGLCSRWLWSIFLSTAGGTPGRETRARRNGQRG